MNDREREMWIMNDEGLYQWWKSTGIGLWDFIRENRKELTEIINKAIGEEVD